MLQVVNTFADYKPVNETMFKLSYVIVEDSTLESVMKEQNFLSDKNINIKVLPEPPLLIPDAIKNTFISIPFENQQLQGYLGKRIAQNLQERLLKVDEDGLLNGFMQRPGNHE